MVIHLFLLPSLPTFQPLQETPIDIVVSLSELVYPDLLFCVVCPFVVTNIVSFISTIDFLLCLN